MKPRMTFRVGVLTCSTLGAQGARVDESGALIKELCRKWWKAEVAAYRVIPDDRRTIVRFLKNWCAQGGVDLILTTGGTGFSPSDVTPEATRDVITREAPGLAELLRREGAWKTPLAWLSRGVAGLSGKVLIINLPGSPKAVRENLTALKNILPHAMEIASGRHEGKPAHPR